MITTHIENYRNTPFGAFSKLPYWCYRRGFVLFYRLKPLYMDMSTSTHYENVPWNYNENTGNEPILINVAAVCVLFMFYLKR